MTETAKINQLVDNLFRHEAGKMVAVLTRIFGVENLGLAEDVVQDALVEAMNQWVYKGVPANPSAWLFTVAKNKALNIVNRDKYKRQYASDVSHYLQSEWTVAPAIDHLFSDEQIVDDQLRMMFTCCHPAISADSQVALTLKTLCGFSIPEIAKAFFTPEENINKRLVRARQKIREANIAFEVPQQDALDQRLDAVLETIYLLFNEGYSASTGDAVIRFELCAEAIRLAEIITQHNAIQDKSGVNALLALMLLNASRFKSRTDEQGNILQMQQQNRKLWDAALMQKGFYYLNLSAQSTDISQYHVLAAISACHCAAPDFASTDWKSILLLYDRLVQINNSPVVLLNRAVVVAKVEGAAKALAELELIENDATIKNNYLFYSTKAEFFMELGDFANASGSFTKAIALATLPAEKKLLQSRRAWCEEKIF